MSRHEVDMAAVQQDAVTIQSLSARSLDELDLADPVVAALAAWVTEVDDGIDDTVRFSIGRDAEVKAPPETGRGRRAALVAGSTVFALVISGGAAAAVTGDPLLVVKAPFRAIAEVNPFDDDASDARDRLPGQAPAVAVANKLLADAQRAMARGDVEEAERLLAEAEVLLGDTVNPGQQNRIDKVTDDIANTPNRGPKDDQGQGKGGELQRNGPQSNGPQSDNDQGSQNQGPQDKDPKGEPAVDKDPQAKSPDDKGSKGKPTEPPGKPGDDDTTTKQGGGTSKDTKRTGDPAATRPEKPSKATDNG